MDYYTMFSLKVELRSDAERKWFERHLRFEKLCEDGNVPLAHYSAEGVPETSEAKLWELTVNEAGNGMNWEFSWSILERPTPALWIRSDGSVGSPYQVACVLQYFLEKMRPEGYDMIELDWADTCSEMHPGVFCGGVMVITKDGIGTCGAIDQLEMAQQRIIHPWLG